MTSKTLTNIPGLNPEDVVTIKKYTYAEKSKLMGKCAKINMKNPENSTLDMEAYKIYVLVYGVDQAPFFGPGVDKVNAIGNLTPEVGDYLFNKVAIYNSLQEMDELKKK